MKGSQLSAIPVPLWRASFVLHSATMLAVLVVLVLCFASCCVKRSLSVAKAALLFIAGKEHLNACEAHHDSCIGLPQNSVLPALC